MSKFCGQCGIENKDDVKFFSFQRSPLECIQKYKESKSYNMNSQARALELDNL